ncbi:MAG: lysophospholipid acyltransferase family protein [Myxococcota bacterium]
MSHVLSLRTVYEAARITVPTFLESYFAPISRDVADRRLAEFARRVVRNARIDIQVEGRERVPGDHSFVYMSNHQSHMDIPVLYSVVPARSLRMVGKKELFRVPLWGRAMRVAGFVEIDRQNRSKAIASLDQAVGQVRDGTSIWIAPEGSRSRTGQLGRLKKGGFHLARDAGVPIVPVALSGTLAILPPGTTSTKSGCAVKVVFGDPIPVEGRTVDDLLGEVERFLRTNVSPA